MEINKDFANEVEILCVDDTDKVDAINSFLNKSEHSKIKDAVKKENSGYQILVDDGAKATTAYFNNKHPSNYMIDKWGYLYSTSSNTSSDMKSFEIGTMTSTATMRNIVNAAIKRVNDYKEPWDR